MGLLDKWNKNKFSIYKSEEKTVLKLIESIGKWLEDLIEVTDNKTDLHGDHKGSWQGLNRPTLSEEGMRSTVEQLTDETIPNIETQIDEHTSQITDIAVNIEKYKNLVVNGDWSNAINQAIADLPSTGGTILIPQGKEYDANIVLNKNYVTITGGGTIKGNITIGDDTVRRDMFFDIHGITIKNDTFTEDTFGIRFKKARLGKVYNVKFVNVGKAFYIANDEMNFHDIGSIELNDNIMSYVYYGLYVDYNDNSSMFPVNDISFRRNFLNPVAKGAVYGKNIDGIVANNNYIFFPGYETNNTVKQEAFYLEMIDWSEISNNQIFESGGNGIRLHKFRHVNICENRIAWCGQNMLSSGIYLSGGDLSGNFGCESTISNNLIIQPSKHGIEISAECGEMSINNNFIRYNYTPLYVGHTITQEQLNSLTHYGISIPTDCIAITCNNNNIYGGVQNNIDLKSKNTISNGNLEARGLVSGTPLGEPVTTGSTLNFSGINILPTAHVADTTVTSFTGGYNGKRVIIIPYNNRTTIQHNSKIRLKDNTDVTLKQHQAVEFIVIDNLWIQIQ